MAEKNGKIWAWRLVQAVAGMVLTAMSITTPLVVSAVSNINEATHALSERLTSIEATVSQVDELSAWRNEWVNRVRELDATQSASIQFLQDSVTEVKIDLRALKVQSRADASEFMHLLLDIRDRMPAVKNNK